MRVKLFFLAVILCFSSCEDDFYKPKPVSYFRIDLPEKEYEDSQLMLPFEFEKPIFSIVEQLKNDPNKFNLVYPLHKAKIHFTYFDLSDKELNLFLEDAYGYAYKHNGKASAINTQSYSIDSARVHGLLYDLKGNVASPIQFFATDSTNHFLRGALYFSHKPNADSILPVLNYIKQDVVHLYETLHWK